MPQSIMHSATPSFSSLPEELKAKCLEMAAQSKVSCILSLLLVSREFARLVSQNVLPLISALDMSLASNVVISDEPSVRRLLDLTPPRSSDSLLSLSLYANNQLARKLLQSPSHSIKRLHRLDLSFCSDIQAEDLDRLDHVSFLVLQGCKLVDDASFFTSKSKFLGNIRGLDLSWCNNIGDSALKVLAAKCRQLQTLELKYCDGVSDHGIALLGSSSATHTLLHLGIAFCPVSDNGLRLAAGRLRALRTLTLAGRAANGELWLTGNWTARGVDAVREERPELEVRFV
mmetsp:Transcript_10243/g.25746  ORF Transcript_10243/g.25746 Transcript_10243/m.25746 type:complete len:287 (+) Transcript_10243:25-885(+)